MIRIFIRSIGRLIWVITLLWGVHGSARDVFVLISGGGSPFGNNFSQYLQAQAVAEGFSRGRPTNSVWIFFGAGNQQGAIPVFGDVRRRVKDGKRSLDSWIPGSLPNNRPARRELILQTFEKEILPAVSKGGRLFLFVGDHGSRAPDPGSESVITLWGFAPDPTNSLGWRFDDTEMLRVSELRSVLLRGLGKGRVVFCMTQCHSGGFHYLSIPHEVQPDSAWFRRPQESVSRPAPFVPLQVAGFTATDEMSLASGCDAEPTDDEWEGYERFFPEKLFGIDPLTREGSGRRVRSFSEAHRAAVLVDRTIDNPYSTSEQFLERWATLIETRLATNLMIKPKIGESVARYLKAVETGNVTSPDRLFRERQTLFTTFVASLLNQIPDASGVLLQGGRDELAKLAAVVQGVDEEPSAETEEAAERPRRQKGRGSPEMRKLWTDVVRPAWSAAVKSGKANPVLGLATSFEGELLRDEEKGRDIFFAPRGSLEMDVFWHSGYADPKTLNRERAEAVVRWGADRRRKILAWAKTSDDETIRAAAEKLSRPRARKKTTEAAAEPAGPAILEPISIESAAARVLFYRRALAAWAFLLEVNEAPALSRLKELIEIESTPFPK